MTALYMENEKKPEAPEAAEVRPDGQESPKETTPKAPKGDLERFYEQFRNVPLKYLDMFIIACFVLLIVIIAIGVWRANG